MLILQVPSSSSLSKELYNPKTFFTHAASLDQGPPHCPIFPTAASRRSLDRFSVPVWLFVLSDQLLIIGLVSLYLSNYLISRGPPLKRLSSFLSRAYAVLPPVSQSYPPLQDMFPRVTHPSATKLISKLIYSVRLACVKRAASVRSEPGSNSQVISAIPGQYPSLITYFLTQVHIYSNDTSYLIRAIYISSL